MAGEQRPPQRPAEEASISEEALHKAEEYVEVEEGAHNKLAGALGVFASVVAVDVSSSRA